MKIEWSKYKRFFAFGCSFTHYIWPTWANIIANEMPDAEFFNLGKSGGGNLLISAKIVEANNRFKFNETDLVMVMYSTYTREDRWVDGKWIGHGNIFNQDIYSKEWVKEFADDKGYLIRDLALIDMSTAYLKSLPCTSFGMLSVPPTIGVETSPRTTTIVADVQDVYTDMLKTLPPSMLELEFDNDWQSDTKFPDGHPSTIRYFNYLKKLEFNLSAETQSFAENANHIITNAATRDEAQDAFNELMNKDYKQWMMF